MKSKNNYKYNFNFLINSDSIFKRKRFIVSALNLAFLAFFLNKEIKYHKDYILWPDGLFGKLYLNTKKIPGFRLLSKLKIPHNIKSIIVMGNLELKEKKYLKKKFKKKITHIKLINGSINKIIKNLSIKLDSKSLILITLPTPKQEQLSCYLSKKILDYKIICIGGGLAIASGNVSQSPKFVSEIGLEWLWRLKSDTIRRVCRLFYTFYIYIFRGIISKKVNLTFKKT